MNVYERVKQRGKLLTILCFNYESHTHARTHTHTSFCSGSDLPVVCHPSPAPPTTPTLGVLGRLRSCIKGPLFKPDRERKSALEVKTEGAGERWRPQGCTSGVITRLPPACQENADIPALATTAAEPLLPTSSTPTHTYHH